MSALPFFLHLVFGLATFILCFLTLPRFFSSRLLGIFHFPPSPSADLFPTPFERLFSKMPVQAYRAARLLRSSQENIITDGAVTLDTESGKILAAGAWEDIRASLIDKGTVEDLGDVTLMPGS